MKFMPSLWGYELIVPGLLFQLCCLVIATGKEKLPLVNKKKKLPAGLCVLNLLFVSNSAYRAIQYFGVFSLSHNAIIDPGKDGKISLLEAEQWNGAQGLFYTSLAMCVMLLFLLASYQLVEKTPEEKS
jgi:hypothetical protein